jgi:putative ABC transport system permease protein
MALGADRRDVLKLILRQGMTLVLLGVVVGLASAYGLTKYLGRQMKLSQLLYGVQLSDPLTYGMITVLLTLVALGACSSLIPRSPGHLYHAARRPRNRPPRGPRNPS